MRKLISLSVLVAILVSCSTSNHVVQDGLFQKRKYTSGWFVKNKKGGEKKFANEEKVTFKKVQKEESSLATKQVSSSTKQSDEQARVVPKKQTSTNAEKETTTKTKQKSQKKVRKTRTLAKQQDSHNIPSTSVKTFGKERSNSKVKSHNSNQSSNNSSGVGLVLLVILAIIIPPLAVYLVDGASKIFVIDLILFIIGISSVWFFSLGGIASLAAIIIALLVVFGLM